MGTSAARAEFPEKPVEMTVLFGGNDGLDNSDVWEWDGVDWIERKPPMSPSPRGGARLAYDAIVDAGHAGTDGRAGCPVGVKKKLPAEKSMPVTVQSLG